MANDVAALDGDILGFNRTSDTATLQEDTQGFNWTARAVISQR